MIEKFDVVIVGGGMVGQTCALALAESQVRIALISPDLTSDIGFASLAQQLRVSAINQASINAFKQLGIWQNLPDLSKAAYSEMEVWDKNNTASIQFSSEDNGGDSLGYIVENFQLETMLTQALEQQSSCTLFNESVTQLNQDNEQVLLQLSNGQLIQSKILIVADGADSQLRQWLDIPLTFSDYGQKAIVAKVKTSQPHQGIARQVFTPDGPLAFLPLADPNQVSIVWSQTTETAQELMLLTDAEFNKKLSSTIDCVVGLAELDSQRLSFPLKMRYAQTFMVGRCVLIGDAAHTIHPLAGQGANLGLLDALAVAESLIEGIQQSGEFNLTLLKQTTRWRQAEAVERIVAMQIFKQGFGNEFAPIKLARALVMNALDNTPFIKQKLAALAMGTTGKLPKLAQTQL